MRLQVSIIVKRRKKAFLSTVNSSGKQILFDSTSLPENGMLLKELDSFIWQEKKSKSLLHRGITSDLTVLPRNIIIYFYEEAPSRYMHNRFGLSICLSKSCIVDYIKKHIAVPFAIKDISNAENISVPHLQRIFKEHTGGLTVGRFIQNLRIKQAHEMLIHSEQTIAEIATVCGFSDQFVFSRAFKRFVGISPAHYRKKQSER